MTVLATLMGNVEARTEKQMSQEVYRIRLINSKEIDCDHVNKYINSLSTNKMKSNMLIS